MVFFFLNSTPGERPPWGWPLSTYVNRADNFPVTALGDWVPLRSSKWFEGDGQRREEGAGTPLPTGREQANRICRRGHWQPSLTTVTFDLCPDTVTQAEHRPGLFTYVVPWARRDAQVSCTRFLFLLCGEYGEARFGILLLMNVLWLTIQNWVWSGSDDEFDCQDVWTGEDMRSNKRVCRRDLKIALRFTCSCRSVT